MMQVQPCRSAWCLRGCVLNCANKCDFACGFCMPLGFSWLPNRGRREWFRDIVACLELSVHWVRHWVPSGLIYFALDFEVESMWFFQLEYMNLSGWLLMFFYWPSKYLIAQRLDDLDVDLAFFRQGHSNWNTESRHLGSQMRFDNDIRIHQDFEVFRRHLTREVNTYCSARVKLWFALVNRQGAQLETQKMKKFQLHSLIAVECFGMYWEGWEGWTEADHGILVMYCQWTQRKRMYVRGLTIWQPHLLIREALFYSSDSHPDTIPT